MPPSSVLVRYEPSLNRAVDFAVGERLLNLHTNGRVELTASGYAIAEEILAAGDILTDEVRFFKELGLSVTEQLVVDLTNTV
jgi:hypothetical protein